MKTLLLMRHAKSSWADPGMDDHERPLNKRGLRNAPRMGDWLKEQGLTPDLILSSSAVRAQQTAQAMAAALEREVQVIDELYLAGLDTWKRVLNQHSNHDTVLAIGHNPGLEEFVSRVSGDYEQMPTAAIAWFAAEENFGFSGDLQQGLSLQTVWRPKELD